jgi:hypothetical protein
MKQLYKAIQNLFRQNDAISCFEAANLKAPDFIDLYNGQPEAPEEFEFTTPALFIDYSITWDRGGSMRRGELTLEVHVLTAESEDTDNLNAELRGMDKIDYYEMVSDLLEDLETCETGKLILKNERPAVTDYFNYHILTFTCTISRRRTQVTESKIGNISVSKKTYMVD